MSDIIQLQEPAGIVSQAEVETLRLEHLLIQGKWAAAILQIAVLYNYKHHEVFKKDHATWNAFLQSRKINERTARHHLSIAEAMVKLVNKATGPGSDKFLFTADNLTTTFEPYFKKSHKISITELGKRATNLQLFINYLEGNSDLKNGQAVGLLECKAQDETEPAPAVASKAKRTSMHDRILGAGYKYKSGKYLNPDTHEEITTEELAEFVDDETGMMLPNEVKLVLESAKEEVNERRETLLRFFKAYRHKRRSPEFQKVIDDTIADIQRKADELAFLATTVTQED